jgi:cytochrome c oxidase subunit 4
MATDSHSASTPVHVTPPNSHGAHDDASHVAKHVKGYIFVGILLLVFTVITVALSYVNFDHYLGGHGWNFIIAMIVATFKAGMVAAIFMHLKGERITIWRFLIFTAIFVAGLFLLTLLHDKDPIMGTTYNIH